jgi:hypothetical protein
MLFVIPSLIVFVAGFIAFVRSALTNRTVVSIIMAVISASVCLGLIINAVSAAKELNSQAHQEICGRGL